MFVVGFSLCVSFLSGLFFLILCLGEKGFFLHDKLTDTQIRTGTDIDMDI